MKVTIDIEKKEVLRWSSWMEVNCTDKKEEPFFKYVKEKVEELKEIELTTPELIEAGVTHHVGFGVVVQLRENFKAMKE